MSEACATACRSPTLARPPLRCAAACRWTLLIVDQFEELFTAASDQDDAAFAALLLALADSPSDIRVLLTVRSDYFNLASGVKDAAGRPALFERLTADNNDAMLGLKAMSPAGLREAVLEPLKLAGETNATSLADAVQTDISHQASDLPLLQVALRAAWQRHHPNGPPMLDCYQSVGRVSGALANVADMALRRLPTDDRGRLESIFVRLVRPGDAGGATRIGASLDDFDPPRRALLQKLGEDEYGRLVSVSATHAELAHEALITQWPWLQGMLNANSGDVRRLERLIERTNEWSEAAAEKKAGYLATGAERELFCELAERRGDWFSQREKSFVTTSEKAFQNEIAAKKAAVDQHQRERDAEQARKLADAHTIARRTLIGAGMALTFAIAAGAFGFYAQVERRIADKNAEEALKQRDAADSALAQTQEALGRSIWAKFDFGDQDLQPPEIDGLWEAAQASGSQRTGFVQPLIAGEPGIVAKFVRRPDVIMRSLGLSWRSAEPILKAVSVEQNPRVLTRLVHAAEALPVALTAEQAQAALPRILTAIAATKDPDQLQALAPAVQALAGKLTAEQGQAALPWILTAIAATKGQFQLEALAQAVRALAGKLTVEQAQAALPPFLTAIAATKDPDQLQALAPAVQALAGKLTAEQAQAALQPILTAVAAAKNPFQLFALAQAVQALPVAFTAKQAQAALQPILTAIAAPKEPFELQALAQAVQALAGKLTAEHAQAALPPILTAAASTKDPFQLQALAQAVQALPVVLTAEQTEAALQPVLTAIAATKNPFQLFALVQAVHALPVVLTADQAKAALQPVLAAVAATEDQDQLQALAPAVQALAAKLTAEQALAALPPILTAVAATKNPDQLQALAPAVEALAGKLTAEQAQAALPPILTAIAAMKDPDQLQAFAPAVGALAGKLTAATPVDAFDLVRKELAAARTEEEAVAWAGALATLAKFQADDEFLATLVEALKYPTTAGKPTEAIIQVLHERFPNVHELDGSLADAMPWFIERLGADAVARPPTRPM
jgi:hypothetical protein